MSILAAERPSPFRPIRNSFERVLPAVRENARGVLQSIRDTGRNMADRMRHAQVQDASRLAQARATIAHAVDVGRTHVTPTNAQMVVRVGAQAAKEAAHYVATHKMEIAKKAAPSLAVSITAKVAGAALAAPVIAAGAAAGGANEARRNISTMRKAEGIFATSAVLRRGFETSAQRARPQAEVNAAKLTDEQPSILGRLAQSKVGRGMRAYMRAEKSAASYVATHNAHIGRVVAFAPDAVARAHAITDIHYLNRLRMDAAMARMTATTDHERAAARIVHQAARKRMEELASAAGPDSAIPYINSVAERQILRAQRGKQFDRSYRHIAMRSIATASGVRAVKSALSSAAVFLGLSAVGVRAANPLGSLQDTMWGNISDGIGKLAHSAGQGAQDLITQVLTATTPAAEAAELSAFDAHRALDHAQEVVASARPASAIHAPLGRDAWSAQTRVGGREILRDMDPHLTMTEDVVDGKKIIEARGVLASGTHTPVMPSDADTLSVSAAGRAPVVPRVAVAPDPRYVTTPVREVAHTVQESREYTIEGQISWTQDIFNRKLLSGMEQYEHSMDWYGMAGTGQRMVQEVFAVNPDLMDADDMQQMQEYLGSHPDASFVQMWRDLQHTVFSDDMDRLTGGATYQVLSEHTAVEQNPLAELKEEDALVMGARRASKPPGLAKYVLNIDQQAAPPQPAQTYTRNGVPIQNIFLNQGVGNSANQTFDQSGSVVSVTSNGIPIQRIDTQAVSITTRSGIPIQSLQGPEGAPSNVALDGRIPVQKITLTMSTSGFPDNSIPTQSLSLHDSTYQGTTSNGIPIQHISLDQHPASSSDTRIPIQRLNGIPRSGEAIPVQQITLDPIGSYQEADGYYDSSVSTHTPFYDYFDGRNGDTTVRNVVSNYDPRFGMFESTAQWDTLHFKLNDVNHPYLAPNDVLCASGHDGSTVCGMHSGTNSAGFLPEEFARRHYQVADAPSQMRSDTFRSRAQVLQMAAEEARLGYTREFNLGGGVTVTYKLVETALVSSEDVALFTESPTMVNLAEHGALLTYYCTHGSIRAWDTFMSLYQNLQANGTTIPSDVQEAYAIMQRQASEAEIDKAAQVVQDYLQRNHPSVYQEFMRWYKLAITEEEQQQGALVQKWMPVTGR